MRIMRKFTCILHVIMVHFVCQMIHSSAIERGNDCPESQPWPCRTPKICLSFDFICDGEPDCPDEYDEDPEMCTAKLRPAQEHLAGFIHKYQNWLIPNVLGRGTPEELASKLVGSKTVYDYAKSAQLTEEELNNLIKLMEGVKEGKQFELFLMGMPFGAWSELYTLFHRIYLSGFLDNVEQVENFQQLGKNEKQLFWENHSQSINNLKTNKQKRRHFFH